MLNLRALTFTAAFLVPLSASAESLPVKEDEKRVVLEILLKDVERTKKL